MLTISPIKSSSEAVRYFEKDNYYTEEEGVRNSQWLGDGSELLQLHGKPIDPDMFKDFLEGKVDGVQLGRKTADGIQHRPGWDLTFSAPKSVSILSEVYGYQDIRQAHLTAVKKALAYIQANAAITRLKECDSIVHVNTKNSIFATFTHDVSRELDPQLHTHSIMINATKSIKGWRSLSTEKLFELPKKGGMAYRSALAVELTKLGYQLRQHRDGPEFFEIDGVPQSLIDDFSERSKQIRAYFKDRSIPYDPGLAKQIALITRKAKTHVDRNELTNIWKDRLNQSDFKVKPDLTKDRRQLIPLDPVERTKAIRRIVRKSIRHHLERDMAFKTIDISKTTLKMTFGQLYFEEIENEINRLIDNKYLMQAPHHTDHKNQPLWTTKKMKHMERDLIDFVERNKSTHAPLVAEARAKSFLHKQGLNEQQLNALLKAVESKGRAFAIQGDPGVGKTHTLRAYRKLLNKQGYDVIGLAPTYQAVSELTSSLQIQGMTVDRFLVDPNAKVGSPNKQQVWFVDEASMLSIDKMNSLLERAEQENVRVLLTGDHKQLEAVGPGRAFYQLQQSGLENAVIDKRMRQKNEHLQNVVQKVMDKDYPAALTAMRLHNDIVESPHSEGDSIKALANEWLSRDKKQRENTLIVAPTNEQRKHVNAVIRASLKASKEIGKLDYTVPIMEDRYLTNQEKRLTSSYKKGDVIRFSRDFKATDNNKKDFINRGEYFDVVGFNHDKNILAVKSRVDKRTIYIDPVVKGGNIKGGIQVFKEIKTEFSKGDKVRWVDNSKKNGLKRNTEATIQGIGEGYVRINTGKKSIKLNMNDNADRHFCHDYAKTAYGVQGKTEKEVLALMQSNRINTTNQRAFMVAVTRAEDSVKIYTDSAKKLSKTLRDRSGDNTEALTQNERKVHKKQREQRLKQDFSRTLALM